MHYNFKPHKYHQQIYRKHTQSSAHDCDTLKQQHWCTWTNKPHPLSRSPTISVYFSVVEVNDMLQITRVYCIFSNLLFWCKTLNNNKRTYQHHQISVFEPLNPYPYATAKKVQNNNKKTNSTYKK